MAFLDEVIKRVRDYDAARPRSVQAEVGWSEAGGCRAYLGYRLDGAWPSEEPDTWAAIRGTAIHEHLGAILDEPGVLTEVTTSYRGIPGHADLVRTGAAECWDFKTTRLANSKQWQSSAKALRQKRIQVHGYAAGLVEAGTLPEDCTAGLLVIPVDGTFADWWAYSEPFDRSLADEGAARLAWVRERVAAGEHLPKDMPYSFCESWCEFFSLCRGGDDPKAAEEITDPELASAVARYGEINSIIGPLDKEKKALAPLIRGLRGTAGDWRVSTGDPGEEKEALDELAVYADYAAMGRPVPVIAKPGATARLTVTRIKRKAEAG
jgi:hypothetical protein